MNNMKFVIMIYLLGYPLVGVAEVTLDAILDQELVGTGLAETLPYRDASTPEKAFMGYLRATAKVSTRDYLYWFTPDHLIEHFGIQNSNEITDEEENAFANQWDGYKFRLASCQMTTNGDTVIFNAVTYSSTTNIAERAERQMLRAKQINGEWKFYMEEIYSEY